MANPSEGNEAAPRHPLPDEAREDLEAADAADDEVRLDVLEKLHSALQEEIDAGEAPSTGR